MTPSGQFNTRHNKFSIKIHYPEKTSNTPTVFFITPEKVSIHELVSAIFYCISFTQLNSFSSIFCKIYLSNAYYFEFSIDTSISLNDLIWKVSDEIIL